MSGAADEAARSVAALEQSLRGIRRDKPQKAALKDWLSDSVGRFGQSLVAGDDASGAQRARKNVADLQERL